MRTLKNTATHAQKPTFAPSTSPAHSISTPGSKRTRHGYSPNDPINSSSSTGEIAQALNTRIATNKVDNSDDSSLSTTMSAEDQSDLAWIPHQAGQSTTPHPPDDVSEEEVISTWLTNPPAKRHKVLPQAFDRQGRLRQKWKHLRQKIEVAKEERKGQEAVNELKMQSILEPPLGVPKGFNVPPTLQNGEEVVEQLPAEEPRISFQDEDAGVILHAQFSDANEQIDSTIGGHPSPLSLPSQTKVHAPRKGNFSTQSSKKLSNLKTYGQGRNQTFRVSKQKAQKRAENSHPGRNLRSGLSAKPSDAFQSPPAINITPEQSNAQQLLSLPPAKLPTPSEIPPSSPLKEIERSPAPDTITVDSSQAPRQKSTLPLPSQAGLVLASPSAREQETATRVLHGRLQQHLSRNPESCRVCHQKACLCNATAQHLEEILCSDIACYKKWWGVDDLWSDAQESKRKFNCWFCPQCSNKARVLLQYELAGSASASISRIPATLTQEPPGHSGRPDKGSWPEDRELQEPLQHLAGMLQQYTCNTTMARNKLSPIDSQTRVLDIPCVRDETLNQPAGSANNAIRVIRKLLDVPAGVLIKDKIRQVKLQDMTCPIWIRGVLSFLIGEFVFNSGSPFEDATLWKKTLAAAGHSADQAETLIHDHRIRLMKAYKKFPDDPEIPPEFLDRVTRRHQAFVEQLNATMLPLVGGDSNVQARHQNMARVALQLNLRTSAYRGTFEEIKPHMLDSFESERHAEENPGSENPDLAGKLILVTTMVGVRFKHPEKDWRTCAHAKVMVWPKVNTERDQANRTPLPDMPGGHPSQQANQRIVPNKRKVGEVA